jgi:hypothetical protein
MFGFYDLHVMLLCCFYCDEALCEWTWNIFVHTIEVPGSDNWKVRYECGAQDDDGEIWLFVITVRYGSI